MPVVPICGILFCVLLTTGLPLTAWLRLVVWLLIRLAIYFIYGRHHLVLRRSAIGRT